MNQHSTTLNRKQSPQTIVTRRHPPEVADALAWTDGSCYPNPGPGGWGVRLERRVGRHITEVSGADPDTTNNAMELLAIVRAVEMINPGERIIVCTDSQLCVLCGVGRWKRKKNLGLWSTLDRLSATRTVYYEWWKGHIGTPGNEAADRLAGEARASITQGLQ